MPELGLDVAMLLEADHVLDEAKNESIEEAGVLLKDLRKCPQLFQRYVLQETLRQLYILQTAFQKKPDPRYRNAAAQARSEFSTLRRLIRFPGRSCLRMLRSKAMNVRGIRRNIGRVSRGFSSSRVVPWQKIIDGELVTLN